MAPVAAALALAGSASAGSVFGVADERPQHAADGGSAFFSLMNDVGLREIRLTTPWDPGRPTTIANLGGLERMFSQAEAHDISVVLGAYPIRAAALTQRPSAPYEFADWAARIVRTFPQVRRLIVGNELNVSRFLQPQFTSDCRPKAGATYMQTLARTYDAVKSVDPSVTVVTSISARGNDQCHARSNISRSPYRFIHDMGVAFRAMGRDRPAWDEFGIHTYPNQPTDPLLRGYPWPNIGFANLDRLKQALWDAFADTPQPTFGWSPPFGRGIAAFLPTRITIGEVGWQVGIPAASRAAYFGTENVRVTTEAAQAEIYSQLVRTAECDPDLRAAYFFTLIDEPNLDRFQSGLIRADGTKRESYSTVKRAIAETGGRCAGKLVSWKPARNVIGGRADFGSLRPQWWKHRWWGFKATAAEEASYRAGIFRVTGRSLSRARRDAIVRSLAGLAARKPSLGARGVVKAYWKPLVRFPARRLRPGRYVYAIRLTAAMNAKRSSVFTSRPFRVNKLPPAKPRRHR